MTPTVFPFCAKGRDEAIDERAFARARRTGDADSESVAGVFEDLPGDFAACFGLGFN